jgi:hypothetical protein
MLLQIANDIATSSLKPWKAFPPLGLKSGGIHGLKPKYGDRWTSLEKNTIDRKHKLAGDCYDF